MQIQQFRGVESFEFNDDFIVVKNPIESVAKTFSQVKHSALWEHDVYDREIDIIGPSWLIFQFREHSWTLIHDLKFIPARKPVEDAQTLSRLLNTLSLYYAVSDTYYYINYELYKNGMCVERLESDVEVGLQFESKLRQLKVKEIREDAYTLTNNFFMEQSIYIPTLFWPKYETGQRVTLRLQGHVPGSIEPITFERSHFERMDYIALAQSPINL